MDGSKQLYLCGQNTVHGQYVDLLGNSERWNDLGTKQIGTANLDKLVVYTPISLEGALIRHVSGGSFGDEEELGIRCLEYPVVQSWADKTIGLAIPILSVDELDLWAGKLTWSLVAGSRLPCRQSSLQPLVADLLVFLVPTR